MFPIFRPAVAALLVAAVAACSVPAGGDGGSADNPALDEAEARAIATTALEAFNSCDYAGWSAAWDGAMKSAIREDAFSQFCRNWLDQAGAYRSIDGVVREPAQTPGHVKYVFTTSWDRGRAAYTIVVPTGGELVSGNRLEPLG